MCGIVGALSFDPGHFVVAEPYLTRMRDTMVHRGPDGAGLWIAHDGRIGFGHRRLSIIDLSESAAQPMSNEDDTLWLTFNGEIYNHAALRETLDRTGRHRWKTDHSDTEVILHAFEEWGIDCLKKLRGMFAFALWDTRTKALWLARDPMGIKPLYYSMHHGRLTFASEIKALLADPDQKRAVDETAFFHFLSFMAVPAPDTLFEGIRKLGNATWLKVTGKGDLREQRYWDVWEGARPSERRTDAEIADELLRGLRESVSLRKVSDVPVGVFLSGGIDSSTNTALFSEGEAKPVKTFSIGYDGEYSSYKNEFDFARMMAERVGAEHHERLLSLDDLVEFLPRMIELQDEPIADPVCIPVFYVSELARQNGVVVCQVGEGADELFWGYPDWRRNLRLQRFFDHSASRPVAGLAMAAFRMMGKQDGYHYEWLRRGASGTPVFWGGAQSYTETHKKRLLSPDMQKKFRGRTAWDAIRPIRERFESIAPDPSALNWMSYLDLNFRLPELLLMRVDKMSMGVSLECRVPFLDHKFVEFAMSIPPSVKTRNNCLKYILKQAVTGLIPKEIIHRKKQGFGVPLSEWFLDRLGDLAAKEVVAFSRKTNLLDTPEVQKLMGGTKRARGWYLFNLALWSKHHGLT